MAAVTQPTILVIIGVSGDLAQRKLLPALEQMATAGVLPKDFRVVGITRQKLRIDDVLPKQTPYLKNHFELFQMDLSSADDYTLLAAHLEAVEKDLGVRTAAQRLFYISVPPQVSQPVVQLLGKAKLNSKNDKLLLEKPFGTDLVSAEELVTEIHQYYKEEQVYRIDHYLAKEMAQNLIIFRSSNALFNNTWNGHFIEKITILASEKIGIEGRATFYEQTGALRDVLQSHLLQLAALTLMELPKQDDWGAVSDLRKQALQALQVGDVSHVVRAQYDTYQTEVQNPGSTIETFASIPVTSRDTRWHGVPIVLMTGKALDQKTTEIHIDYRAEHPDHANKLVMRIQPREGAEISVQSKEPGYDRAVQTVHLKFAYGETSNMLDAYEQVFLSAMNTDRSLFTSSEEVLASWRIVQPVLDAWSLDNASLTQYHKGTPATDIIKG